MSAEITQSNVRLLIPGKAAVVASLIAAKRSISPKDALLIFYRSPTYRKLEQEATKYWHYSPEQLFWLSGFSRPVDTSPKNGPGHSALLPFRKEILTAWNRRQSAANIAAWLADHGIKTTSQNVWKFIRQHAKKQSKRMKQI